MTITASTIAAGVGASVSNTQFAPTADVLARKMVVIGTYDPLITTITDEVPALVTSEADAAATYGRGFMLHRLVRAAMAGSVNSETWVIPQAEPGGAVQSAGTVTATGPSTAADTLYLYVAGELVAVALDSGDSSDDIATKIAAAITADLDSPITAVVNGVTTNQVDVTAKSAGPWGDAIKITTNENFGEKDVPGVSLAIVAMSGGSGLATIADALDGMGTGDNANLNHFTELAHGNLQDQTSLTSISTYNGVGNSPVGCYAKTVARPFRSLVGDVAAGSAGLSALITLADANKSDRTNGVLPVPGSPDHPAEIAAKALGVMQFLNATRAEETAYGKVLPEVTPGALADQWTSDITVRDTAVKNGISTTVEQGGAIVLQNMMTFYRPDSIPASSNGYRSQRNISIIQNILDSTKTNFQGEKWLGATIVEDKSRVTNATSRQKARSVEDVRDDALALAEAWLSRAWLYEIDNYTKDNITVTIRSGTTGFDLSIPVILSGENWVIDTRIPFDTSITVLL